MFDPNPSDPSLSELFDQGEDLDSLVTACEAAWLSSPIIYLQRLSQEEDVSHA